MIFLEGLECDGTESSLLDCPMDMELGLSICDHSDDAGIRCYGTYVHTYIDTICCLSCLVFFLLLFLSKTHVDIDLSVKTLCTYTSCCTLQHLMLLMAYRLFWNHCLTLVLLYSDTNQCSTDNGGCDHNCTDLIPGHNCSCNAGFLLNSDERSCDGKF